MVESGTPKGEPVWNKGWQATQGNGFPKLWSLFELLNAYPSAYSWITGMFGDLRASLANADDRESLSDEQYKSLLDALSYAYDWVGEMNMTAALYLLVEIQMEAQNNRPSLKAGGVYHRLGSIMSAIRSELIDRYFYYVSGKLPSLCFTPRAQWGAAADKFPSAAIDIDEASYCRALGRATASVFHLMRVLQVALGSLATAVQSPITNPQDQNWLRVIESIDAQIKAMQPGINQAARVPEEDRRFYASAALQFTYFKDAFRNFVTHTSVMYDDAAAESIYNHVRDFLGVLATRLSE